MRLLDQDPIDPEIAATLDAIDATLAGEPVDARYAELAEIALLITSDRPQLPAEFARSMDERVGRRFAPAPGSVVAVKSERRGRVARRFWEATGALAAGVALVVAIVAVAGSGGGVSSMSSTSAASSLSSGASSSSAGSAAAAGTSSTAAASSAPAVRAPATQNSATASGKALSTTAPPAIGRPPAVPSSAGAFSGSAGQLQPPTSGRQIVQSAQLNLTAVPTRVDAVAQEVYNVVGQVNGIVNSSTVTQGGPSGYASFQLSVPSGSLAETMSRLSQLTYAQVTSRTDNTQDITDQYNATRSALGDARALRTSLLKQLANAVTTAQVDSLTTQIHDAEASISSDQATLARLNNQVNFSKINVEINASTPPPLVPHKSGGFGIGRAAHDAGRVLTVVAGGALIAIAALLPVGLVVALVWWVGAATRRRRREQALDSV
jgi:Domain of unknown function (DUF4349)